MKEYVGTITNDREWQVHIGEDGETSPLNAGYRQRVTLQLM
jgi:hypothetical protein